MQTVIILNIIVVILAYFARYKNTRFLFEVSFIIVFLFTALRFNFGTDYPNYNQIFKVVSQSYNITSIDFDNLLLEPAWAILNYIFEPIGFFGFIIVLSAFLCHTYYSLIKKHIDPKYYWLGIFIYVFTSDIMWIQFSAIRQALSVAIFIHSINFLYKKNNPIIFILLNLLGGLFHSSAFFMLPFVFFSFKKIKESKIIGIAILTVFLSFMFLGKTYLSQFIEISSLFTGDRYLSRFEVEATSKISLIGSIAWGILLVIVLYYSRLQQKNKKIFFYTASLYNMVYVLAPLFYLADRIGYYFAAFSVIVYPIIIQNEKRLLIRNGLVFIFLFFIIYRLNLFLKLIWVINGYSEYHTIFSETF